MPEKLRNDAETRAIALREAAVAVLQETLVPTQPVAKVTVIPVGYYMSYVLREPDSGPAIKTSVEVEDRITALLAGPALAAVVDQPDSPDSSAAFAQHLAEELADNQVFDWRRSDPDYANKIVGRCFERAKELVTANEARIRRVAAVLEQRGTLAGTDIASIR